MSEQGGYGEPGEDGRRPLLRTGTEGEVDPEDLAMARGLDPTPENVERERRRLEEEGPAAETVVE
jgi:hypothetical protein